MKPSTETIFLDRDGVINRKAPDGHYVTCWEDFVFLPDAKDALRLIKRHGYRLIVVTNQRGIARRLMTEQDLQQIHAQMRTELAEGGVPIDALYYCPHEVGQCLCRKPQTGLFWRAKGDFPDINFACSLLIGDSLSDMEAGAQLGCRNLLIAEPSRVQSLLARAMACGIAIAGHAPSLLEAAVRYLSAEAPQRLQGNLIPQTEAVGTTV
jgi:D-glycero-D-manno-heptose 1,7-bisphosphate phosphatase